MPLDDCKPLANLNDPDAIIGLVKKALFTGPNLRIRRANHFLVSSTLKLQNGIQQSNFVKWLFDHIQIMGRWIILRSRGIFSSKWLNFIVANYVIKYSKNK